MIKAVGSLQCLKEEIGDFHGIIVLCFVWTLEPTCMRAECMVSDLAAEFFPKNVRFFRILGEALHDTDIMNLFCLEVDDLPCIITVNINGFLSIGKILNSDKINEPNLRAILPS